MTRNNGDFQGGVNKFYAAATASGTWHAHTGATGKTQYTKRALCGADVEPEADNPVARVDGDDYVAPMQWVECGKCEKAILKARGQ